jgi:Cu/Ag efflux protein CusF
MHATQHNAVLALMGLFAANLVIANRATAIQATPGSPCCGIVSINANGVVTAKETQTGRTFQFQVKDQAVLASLHVGQSVWADFAAQAVALAAGAQPCCGIVGARAAGPVALPTVHGITPCCSIVSIAPSGLVTAKETQTGRTFQFQVKDQAVLTSLHVGQSVWADFAAKAVALAAGGSPCCDIVGARAAGPVALPTVHGGEACCSLVANPALTGRLGRLVVAFPAGANAGSSGVDVFKAGESTAIQRGYGAQSVDLLPGTYSVVISGARVDGVTVQSGHDTRLRVGILRITPGGNTRADVLAADGKTALSSGYGAQVIGLPVGNYRVQIAGQSVAVTIADDKITDF